MTTTHALLLGTLQGLTEFLPVSSSGHLVLAEHMLNLHFDPAALQGFDILLHAGTLLALLLVYWKTWWSIGISPLRRDTKHLRLLFLLVTATVPAALAGVLFEETIAAYFRSPTHVGYALLVTAAVLLLSERSTPSRTIERTSGSRSIVIGLAQACALVPGLSRSGLTISAGRFVGLAKEEALDFAFLMAVPVIAGATVLTLKDVIEGVVVLPSASVTLVGFLTSFIVSLVAIYTMKRWIRALSLGWFALYLVPVGIAAVYF